MNQPRPARYGSLDSYVLDSNSADDAKAVVVLCHGYGAPGTDMVGVVGEWAHLLGDQADHFRFICPAAPESLADMGLPSGRAWWPLNMARMMEAVQANCFEDLHRETPPGLDSAREALSQLVNLATKEIADARGVSPADVPLVLGGFSQGAMLTMDTSLRGDIERPNLLIQFSGTVICQAQWTASMDRLNQTHVYQSHGTVDPILPFESAERLRDLLAASKVDAEFFSFAGPHTIVHESIATTAALIQQLVPA